MSVDLSCEPCIDRNSYTVRAILHGTSDDDFWRKLAASARQAAVDMRVNLDLQLYPPGGYTDDGMAQDIRNAASGEDRVDALVVTIPSKTVATAVRYAAGLGMPVFGLNSGYEEVSATGGLVEDGSVLFFSAMHERMGGEEAASYFLKKFATAAGAGGTATNVFEPENNSTSLQVPTVSQSEALGEGEGELAMNMNATKTTSIERTGKNLLGEYTSALFISPLGEINSAFDQRFAGYRDRLLAASNATSSPISVEWFKVDDSSQETIERALSEKLANCNYQSILVSSGRFAIDVNNAIRANGCHDRIGHPATVMGTFDTPDTIFDLLAAKQVEFAIDQHNHMQGWAPVHFAALYVSTGLVLSPPPDGVYLSGPVLFTQQSQITDTLRVCTEDAFPICPNTLDPYGEPSECPCTERSAMVIGGVTHGITTDGFWDTVYAAAEQGAADMGIDLQFDRFEPQESQEILYRKMSAKILSLCQGGVDGLFVTISDPIIVEAVKVCQGLSVPVMSINAGISESEELGLIHHVGMVEKNAGYQAGKKMASMASFRQAYCLNHFPIQVTWDRCSGFGRAMAELGIEYLGELEVPDDNIARLVAIVEDTVDDWEGLGMLLCGASVLPGAMEVKKAHLDVPMASFDTSDLLYESLERGDLLFGVDQNSYMQGYSPIPLLTHAATTKQTFLNHAVESGPSFVLSPPSTAEAACQSGTFAVCPELPEENYNYVNDGLIILGVIFFALQAAASVGSMGWMARYRNAAVVKASQPEFLSLVALGCVMLCSAILPLSIQGGYRFERDALTLEETDDLNDEIHEVDAACMAVPWLVCIGFVLIYSALVAKLRRIEEIVKQAQNFTRAQVPPKKVLGTVVVLLGIMIAILIAWQLVSPLRWSREVTETDFTTGYPTESVGRCTSEHFAAFAGSCAAFIGCCLTYALVLCYRTRSIPLEWSESKYIAASVFYLLQLLVLGLPILVIASENTNSYYMVMSMILFLMSFGTTLLIFVPKVIAHKRMNNRRMSTLMMRAVQSTRMTEGGVNTVEQIRSRVASRASYEEEEEEREDAVVENNGKHMGDEELQRAMKLAEVDDLEREILAKRKLLAALEKEQVEREGALSEQRPEATVSFAAPVSDGARESAPEASATN